MKLRVKFENGHFVPLEAVEDIAEGAEFEIRLFQQPQANTQEADKPLDEPTDDWVDIEGLELYLAKSREQREKAWHNKLHFL